MFLVFGNKKYLHQFALITSLLTIPVCGLLAQQTSVYQKGRDEFLIGNYQSAIKQLLKVSKDSADANYLIAMSYFNLKEYKKSISYFNSEISKNKTNYNAYVQKAKAEHLLGEDKKAQADLEKLISIKSDYFIAYYEIACLNYDHKDYTSAIRKLEEALAIRSNFEKAIYKLGFCYYQLKDETKACEYWKKLEDPDDFEDHYIIEKTCN